MLNMFGFIKGLKCIPLKSVILSALAVFFLALVTVGFVIAQNGTFVQEEQVTIAIENKVETERTIAFESGTSNNELKQAITDGRLGFTFSLVSLGRGLLGIVVLLIIVTIKK